MFRVPAIFRASTRLAARPAMAGTHLQMRALSEQSRAILDKAVKQDPIVLFMKGTPDQPMCGFSRAAVQILGLQNIDHDKVATYNVLSDENLRNDIKEYSNWPTIPQLYVNGEFIGGCDLIVGMHQNGELQKLLEAEGLLQGDKAASAASTS